ncbi:MAG: glutamine--fructose-6-phosphate transaminase (isomerizing) [Bacteroidota bacterium]|nr:glutamine--fructose-6-phosphate transaminase (isomerizing) [Bacteroidota bacterium]
MCGIVGYLGYRQAYPILIKGLQRLEYRGYDSAGVALIDRQGLQTFKKQGKVADLELFCKEKYTQSTIGIGHTRWATHGIPSDVNAHPHCSQDGELAIIHNGIIENYDTIKEALTRRGHTFNSDTDTEALIHLIEDIKKQEETTLFEAVRLALNEVIGAYAIAVIDENKPEEVIVARMGSPLVVGIGENEYFIASDATPIVEYTKEVIYLEEGEIARLCLTDGVELKTIENIEKTPFIQELEMNLESIEKGGYNHFMLKEIFEQPKSISDSIRGRLISQSELIKMSGIQAYSDKIINANRIIIVACGTSWHAGLIGEYLIEDLARINVEVEYASEFRYRNPILSEKDVVLAISQSGETADTLAAMKLAKERGATVLAICNVVGSSIARLSHSGAYTHAGPEIGVASTKAFTAQVSVLTLIALLLAKKKATITTSYYRQLLIELESIPAKVQRMLEMNDYIKDLSSTFANASNFLYLGRGYNFPVALEGALKLKEISYIHAEGYPAAEMKHGPIALIDEDMPIVVIATKKGHYEKIVSNIQEVKARNGVVIAIVSRGDVTVKEIADYVIEVPEVSEPLVPMLANIPLQLLSYHIAVMRGCNVDQPRNLAKSVTVE